MLLLDHIRNSSIYQLLRGVHNSNEGNLLEITDSQTAEAQIELIRYAHTLYSIKDILEIGFNKGMFSLLISHINSHVSGGDVYILGIDVNPLANEAAKILNRSTPLSVDFQCEDSTTLVPKLNSNRSFDLAWVDGNHEYSYALQDLKNVSALGVPIILLDDTNMHTVQQAYQDWLNITPTYTELTNPFLAYDSRKARLFINRNTFVV